MKKPSALLEQFSGLPDPRTGNAKRHELLDIVVITLCAVICYADSWEDVAAFGRTRKKWLKGFLALPNGIPSHDTFGRVFAVLDAKAFEQCLSAWARDAAGVILGKTVAVDGKRLRRSHDRYHGTLALETVSAYLVSSGLVLGQRKVWREIGGLARRLPRPVRLADVCELIPVHDPAHASHHLRQAVRAGVVRKVLPAGGWIPATPATPATAPL